MIRCCVVAMIGTTLLLGCASKEPGHDGGYKVPSARPTSRDWKPGAVWAFVTTKKSGERDSLTFRLTDEIAKTCTGGSWRKLQVVSGLLPQLQSSPSQAAYSVEGSFLSIDLLAGWCDIGDNIRGKLEGTTFTGDRTQGGMMGSDVVGNVHGWRVK
jgi:hypothetical protein